MAKSYLGYLTSNNLIHRKKSAYRPHHSCETALLNLTDNWLKAMDSRKLVGSVLLDLSKAFYLVDHELLLSKIDKYHVTNTSQEWFKSYLRNRTQRCYINGSLSDSLVLARGVPQGSILGPILFSLYINDLPAIGISNSNVDIYADDTTIWESNSYPLLIQRGLQDSLDRTGRWLSLNKMVPNTKKPKYLIIGTVQKLLHSGNPSLELSLCGTPIEEAKDEKLLGDKIDKYLNWDNHIDFLIDKLNSRICLLKRAKTYLNYRLRNLLYNALIRPLFEYCCAVWVNTKNENLLRLRRVQKRCARIILDASYSDNSVERFSERGWLPIDDVIRMRKLCLMYKIVNGFCPQYFKDYISYVNDMHRHNTRASTNNNLFIPLFRTNSGLRTFYACQPIMEHIR